MASVMVIGATGLVGSEVVRLLEADGRFDRLVTPVRRPVPAGGKRIAPVVDFDALPADADWWAVDAVVSALGTTIAKAGSRQAFRKVDHDHPLAVARLARARGAGAFVVISALGANPASRIHYNRVKGELEADLAAVGFASLTILRPGLIGGERAESRPMEQISARLLGVLGPVLPRSLRINPASRIAAAAVSAAAERRPGTRVISSADLA